jgi:hypothetical protein
MPISVTCPSCGRGLKFADTAAGRRARCPNCRATLDVPAEDLVEVSPVPPNYPRLWRELLFIRLRQRVRALCDAARLGPSMGERFCFGLIAAAIPFALSLGLGLAVQEPAAYAIPQGMAAFAIVVTVLSVLVVWGSDEALEARRAELVRGLPAAKVAWREGREQARLKRAAERERARREHEAEEELPPVVPARRVYREEGPVVHVHIHGAGRSGGVAAVLEVVFGLFLGTFGIGHLYAGNVGLGLFLMFGWWLFVAVNVALVFLTCGFWGFVAIVLIPACWFILMIASPLTAASAAAEG